MRKTKVPSLILFMLISILAMSISASAAYQIKYGKANGGSFVNAYSQWNRTANSNETITTPTVSDRSDGTRCYWRANNNTGIGTNEIRSGSRYTVKGNVNFYAVWNKIYTVSLYSNDGKTLYSGICIKSCNGEPVSLPEGPSISGKVFKGWAMRKGSVFPDYPAGKSFRMSGDKTYYAVYANASEYPMTTREKQVYNTLLSFKSLNGTTEGATWTNADYYIWNGGIHRGGFGCAAFAFKLSDAAFGTAAARKITTSSTGNLADILRVGDIIRLFNSGDGGHSAIVIEIYKSSKYIIIAEGNYNRSVHWGRKITFSELKTDCVNVLTRY